jgi:SHS2 domain-containing protein
MIRMLDHTADAGFEIGAPTLKALFDDSVCGGHDASSSLCSCAPGRRRLYAPGSTS